MATRALRRTRHDDQFGRVGQPACRSASPEGTLVAQILIKRVRLVGTQAVAGREAFVDVDAAPARPFVNMGYGAHLIG